MAKEYALISVSDKRKVEEIAQALVDQGIQIISTGGTYDYLKKNHIPVISIESITDFPEVMDGRVKTLHPLIFGGILGMRQNSAHQAVFDQFDMPVINYVVVNLYPFQQTIQKADTQLKEAIEQIDIGGPSLLRAAAKNHQDVTVVTDVSDYSVVIEQLKAQQHTDLDLRRELAKKVFQYTAHYDATIAAYLDKEFNEVELLTQAWDHLTLSYDQGQTLRYGENSHQSAIFYRSSQAPDYSLAKAEQLHGPALSYNNIRDADAGLKILAEFKEACAVAVKHMNPCGVAIGQTIEEAFDRCYQADSVSIFGGILLLNRPVTQTLAERLADLFLDIIIAPAYDSEALSLLNKKKNRRLLQIKMDQVQPQEDEYTSVVGGLLVQSPDMSQELPLEAPEQLPPGWEMMTDIQASPDQLRALNFAMKVVKHVKSNAIVVTNDYMTLGIGAGQMNRVQSAQIALNQAQDHPEELRHLFVLASDAFLPMDDTVRVAHQFGVQAIVQPGGSIRDQDSVDYCNKYQLPMVKTGIRHFRH